MRRPTGKGRIERTTPILARLAEAEGSGVNPTMRPPHAWPPSPGGPALLSRGADQFGAANSRPIQVYCPWSALTHPTIIGIVFQQSFVSHAASALVDNWIYLQWLRCQKAVSQFKVPKSRRAAGFWDSGCSAPPRRNLSLPHRPMQDHACPPAEDSAHEPCHDRHHSRQKVSHLGVPPSIPPTKSRGRAQACPMRPASCRWANTV
jgi:hypothetical protein